ncbi:MAG: amidohydrolase [Defluviitaleaceae bacterium]|nr:amidohydrolase [Defluviitaleaceae bacterium]
MEIIDAHIHPFIEQKDNTGLLRYGGPETPEAFIAGLKRAGITRACGTVINVTDPNTWPKFKRLNADALRLWQMFPDFYIPGIHIHPHYVEESCQEIEEMYAKGVRWVGELVPYMSGHDIYTVKEAFPIYDLMQEKNMVLNIHITTDEDLENLMSAFPRLTIVVAHPDEKPDFERHLDRMRRYKNAYLDISGTGLFRNNLLRYGIDQVGKERFLLGTDYPICNPAMQVQGVLYEPLTDAEYEAVLSGNFLRLHNP